MRQTTILLLLLLQLFVQPISARADAFPYWQTNEQGWFWYHDPPRDEEPVSAPPRSAAAPNEATTPPFSSEWFRANLDRYRDAAIDHPTETNVRTYMYLQRLAMDKAQAFSEAVKLSVYNDPALNEGTRSPDNQVAKAAVRRAEHAAVEGLLKRLGRQSGIWFFYRSDCEYCHAEEPVLRSLANLYGFHVLPISLDGLPLPDGLFPNFVVNSGQAERLGVTVTPTMFLVSPPDKVLKISEGVLATDQIEDRIVELGHEGAWITDEEYAAVHPDGASGGFMQNRLPTDLTNATTQDPEKLLALLQAAAMAGGSTPITATPIVGASNAYQQR